MKLKIDQFYKGTHDGVLKFVGYDKGVLLFDRYDRSQFKEGEYSGWIMLNRIRVTEAQTTALKAVPPPQ